MAYRILQVGGHVLVLLLFWGAILAVESQTIPDSPCLTTLPLLMLTGIFLALGPFTGAVAVLLWGLTGEALTTLPLGRLMIASACAGLAVLYLTSLITWSAVGRGACACIAGAFLWQSLVEFVGHTQPEESLQWTVLLKSAGWQAGHTGLCWLAAAVLVTGIHSVWRQAATRPVRFGG